MWLFLKRDRRWSVPASDDSKTKNEEVQSYEKLIHWGVGTVGGAITVLTLAGKINSLLSGMGPRNLTVSAFLPIALLALTAFLAFLWFFSGSHELSILARYYGERAPTRSFWALPTVIGAAVLLVALAYYSDNLLVYGVLYWIYLLIAAMAAWLTTQHVMRASQRVSPEDAPPDVVQNEIFRYYVMRPNFVFKYVQAAMASFAVACGFMCNKPGMKEFTNGIRSTGYGLLIAAIVINEFFVWLGRARLYARIREQEDASGAVAK
jgi:hypothetical protein